MTLITATGSLSVSTLSPADLKALQCDSEVAANRLTPPFAEFPGIRGDIARAHVPWYFIESERLWLLSAQGSEVGSDFYPLSVFHYTSHRQ